MITPEHQAEAEKARRWARAEHATLLNLKRVKDERGDSVMLQNLERDARRKRAHALVRIRSYTNDRTIPENGTDDEIGAFLGFEPEGVADV